MSVIDITGLNRSAVPVDGIFRVIRSVIKESWNQTKFQELLLGNISGQILAFLWPEKYRGLIQPEHNDLVEVHGRTKLLPLKQALAIDLYDLRKANELVNPFEYLPECSVDHDALARLVSLIDQIELPSLRLFFFRVFEDPEQAVAFVTSKGSYKHHHASQGGLLRHSLEVAEAVLTLPSVTDHERQLAAVAGLLHDLAKTKKAYNGGNDAAPMLRHDTRTLELLARPLRGLEQDWPDGVNRH